LLPARPHSSIVARLFLAVGVPTAFVVVALGALGWRTTRDAVEASLQRELGSVVAAAARTINPRTARAVLPEEQRDSRTYRRTVDKLRGLATSTGSLRVLLVDGGERVRADSDGALALGAPAPRVALDRFELQRALAGTPAVSVPFTGADGRRYLSAYALVPEAADAIDDEPPLPVDERLVLVMEAPAAALDATFAVARTLAVIVGVAVLVVLLLAVVVARTITRPLLSLSRSAEGLAAGRLGEALVVPTGDDEVARLGRTLEQMRTALVDRDAERQMMLAGIAHEVRNPLGGMELFTGLLEEGLAELPDDKVGAPVKQELVDQARRVKKELRYLTGVVNDFLAFARDTPPTREDVDVLALLRDVQSLCARDGAARVAVDDADAGVFPLDRNRIKQALLNLVENALAATPSSGTVTLSARRADGALVLAVVDDGRGIDVATQTKLFTPFFTTKEKGSGLGLALVRRLARDHGGDARLTSAVGQGTRVELTLGPPHG
jgi:signal transduction histidine kinase